MTDCEVDRRYDVSTRVAMMTFYEMAFADVYRSASRLTGGNRAEAEDLVQDAFVRLVRAARDGSVQEVGVGWLITTIRRRHIDQLRSIDREGRRLRLVASNHASPDHMATGADRRDESGALLAVLSDRERTALVLRYVEDLPVAEVAHLMGLTVRATESLLQRAKHKAQRPQQLRKGAS